MDGQMTLFPMEEKPRKKPNRDKPNWENAFQKWSDKRFQDGIDPIGCCGYGVICDYCTGNDYGRPCVRALNETCRNEGITIDYENTTYEDAWYGRFRKENNGRTDKQTGSNDNSSNAERA